MNYVVTLPWIPLAYLIYVTLISNQSNSMSVNALATRNNREFKAKKHCITANARDRIYFLDELLRNRNWKHCTWVWNYRIPMFYFYFSNFCNLDLFFYFLLLVIIFLLGNQNGRSIPLRLYPILYWTPLTVVFNIAKYDHIL